MDDQSVLEEQSTNTLTALLRGSELFSPLTDGGVERLARAAKVLDFAFGDTILDAGATPEGVYLIQQGRVRLLSLVGGKETSLGVRKEGELFAEIAALREYQLEYSVRSSAQTRLVLIPRSAMAEVLAKAPEAEQFVARYVAIQAAGGFVSRLFDLKGQVEREELEDMIRGIGIKRVPAGFKVLEQGSREDRRLYVVRQGRVKIVRHEDNGEYPLATLTQADVFGEKACLHHQDQAYDAIAETDTVLLVIPQKTVHFILQRHSALQAVLEDRIRYLERELQRQRKVAERSTRRLVLDLWAKPKRGERVLRRFPLVEQAEEMDCGAACLAMICRYYALPMTLGKLREMANVTRAGATLESLARVGESLGFTTRGVQCAYESLKGFELPFIAHWEGYHYIVVYGVSSHQVWVADPALGFRKMPRADFERGWNGTCLLFNPGSDLQTSAVGESPWLRFITYLRPYKSILGHVFLATLVIQLLGIAPPIIMQNVLDRVVVHQNYNLLTVLIVGLVMVHLFTQLTSVMRAFLANHMIRSLDLAMMSQFFQHTLSLPLSFFTHRKTGDIFARFQENATIRQFLTQSTLTTLLNLLMVVIYFSVLLMYHVGLTLLLTVLIVPLMVLTLAVTPTTKRYARQAFSAATEAESILMETLSGAETIKGMGVERPMRLKWEKKYAQSLDVQFRAARFNVLVNMLSQMLHALVTVIILYVGARLMLAQELSIGQYLAFTMLMGSVLSPLMGLIGLWDELHRAGVAMERLGDVLELAPEQKPSEAASRILLPDLRGDFELQNVYFRYGGKETAYVLENINCKIKAGQLVAIVGQSGSGKTTLAKLLVGFYPPCEGKILADGYDLSQLDMAYYRAQIGYVMQSNLLFSGTLAENIAVGDDNPDRRRLVEAAKLADAHGFINALPLAYEQVVGERGMGLSGGQIQRICIARALYHDPRVLIFDEATSALDTQSESNILGHMKDILKGRTAIVIAHRLSTIMSADLILVLYEGNVVEQGDHSELLARKGMYYQLVQKQIARAA